MEASFVAYYVLRDLWYQNMTLNVKQTDMNLTDKPALPQDFFQKAT